MKKVISLLAVLAFVGMQAQEVKIGTGEHIIKAGPTMGIPVGDAGDTSSFSLGADFRYQYLKNNFGVGVATGYTHYFGKDMTVINEVGDKIEIEGSNNGIIPLALMGRYYVKNFFVGTDIGYGFLTNTVKDADKGGFYIMPQVGYHADKYNVFAFYQNLNVDNSNIGTIGIGASINLTN